MTSSPFKEPGAKTEGLPGSTLEGIRDPFFILDHRGRFLKSNAKGIELLGYPWEELRQKTFLDVVGLEDLSKIRDGFGQMEQRKEVRLRALFLSRYGGQIHVEFSGVFLDGLFFITLRDWRERLKIEEEWDTTKKQFAEKIREKDQYARDLQVMRDLYKDKLKENERLRQEAVYLSSVDGLTGIYNHRYFIHQLTNEVERQKRYPSSLSLLMIDIDYFKHYNDTNGHLAGDEVLRTIAMLVSQGVRQSDMVARYGGEEFSAILINAGKEKAMEIGERVRRLVSENRFPNEAAQPNGELTVSVGVATFTPPVSTLTELIREADNALYRAKKAGRNRVEG